MEKDVADALDELRQSMQELRDARTPASRRQARDDVAEDREDLEAVLRAHGYRLRRADLDRLVDDQGYESFRRYADRYARELAAEAPDDTDGDETAGDESAGDGKNGAAEDSKVESSTSSESGEEDEEWV